MSKGFCLLQLNAGLFMLPGPSWFAGVILMMAAVYGLSQPLGKEAE